MCTEGKKDRKKKTYLLYMLPAGSRRMKDGFNDVRISNKNGGCTMYRNTSGSSARLLSQAGCDREGRTGVFMLPVKARSGC
jgi:hypothetical protein